MSSIQHEVRRLRARALEHERARLIKTQVSTGLLLRICNEMERLQAALGNTMETPSKDAE